MAQYKFNVKTIDSSEVAVYANALKMKQFLISLQQMIDVMQTSFTLQGQHGSIPLTSGSLTLEKITQFINDNIPSCAKRHVEK